MRTTTRTTRTALAAAAALALALGTAACGDNSDPAADATSTTPATDVPLTEQPNDGGESDAAVVVFQNGWAKATEEEMTGAFGTVRNTGDVDVRVTGVTSPLTERVELHEMVPGGTGMMMQPKEGGFVIPAGGELVLEPGKEHIMLMDLTAPVTTGEVITLVLTFDDGTEQDVTVTARDFQGGQEQYSGGAHSGGMNQDG